MKGEHRIHGSQSHVFTAPLGPATSGRLVFTTSVAGVTLLAGRALQGLARACFVHRGSWIGFEAGLVMVGYDMAGCAPDDCRGRDVLSASSRRPLSPPLHRGSRSGEPGDEITLNASLPWEIELRGAVSDLNADLSALDIRSLDVLGGADRINLLLSGLAKTSFIYIAGGIRNSVIRLPPGVGVRAQVSGGARNLVFGGQHFAAIDRDTDLESSSSKGMAARCNLCIAGGASNLTIGEQDLPGRVFTR